MKPQFLSVTIAAAMILGFGSQEQSSEYIAGAYAREYSFDQLNRDTEQSVGMAIIRDTIYITLDGDNFQVSNAMWRKNDYDNKGWHNLGTNERGAFHTYAAKWNKFDSTLQPVDFGMMNPFKVDGKNGKLILGEMEYERVK